MSQNIILIDNVKYYLWTPEHEVREFEPIIKEHIEDIFGDGCKYFPKRLIKTMADNQSIPDGFVIDYNNKKWYVLELKLLCDDAIRRITNQIVDYKNAIKNLTTRKEIYEAISEDSLYNCIMNTSPEIIIIIDNLDGRKGKQFTEKVNGTDRSVKIIEFKTYAREHVNPEKVHIHVFSPLVKIKSETKIKIEETKKSTWASYKALRTDC